MDAIPRRFGGKLQDWIVYTKEEADELGLAYKDWREAEEGEWSISEDNYVAQVVRINGPYTDRAGRSRKEVVLPYARSFTNLKELNYEDFKRRGSKCFGYSRPKTWSEQEVQRRRAQVALKAYAKLMMVYGGRLPEEMMVKLGKLYRADQKKPEATFKRLIRTEAAQDMLAEELMHLLEDKGVTPERVIEDYEEIKEQAKEARQFNVAKGIVDKYAKMLGMDEPAKEADSDKGVDADWDRYLEEGEGVEGDLINKSALFPAES